MVSQFFLDMQQLASSVRKKRGTRSLREIAREIDGVSLSTLSRIENEEVPTIETFLHLCDWLQVSPCELIKGWELPQKGEKTTVEQIEIILSHDNALEVGAAEPLVQLIERAYKHLTFSLVVLAPQVDVVQQRDLNRPKTTQGKTWAEYLDHELRTTMAGLGLWVDTSEQTPEETVEQILQHLWSTKPEILY